MKAFKWGLLVVAVVVVLVVGVAIYLVNNIDSIVKDIVESEGPKLTQTEVNLQGVNIELRKGRGELRGFRIANPAEFSTPDALVAEELVLDIDPRSIAEDVVVINEIVARGIAVTAEQKGLTTNLQVLLKSLQEASGEQQEPATESNLRLAVETVRFAEGTVSLVTEQHGDYVVELPAFEVENLGSPEKGLTPAELGRAMLQPLMAQARERAQARVEELARDRAAGELRDKARESLGEDAEDKIQRLKGILN